VTVAAERWFGLPLRRILHRIPRRALAASGQLAVSGGISQVGMLVATVVVARALGRADLGEYAAAMGIGAIVVGGVGGGLPVLALRETAAGRVGRAYVMAVGRAQLAVTLVGSVVAGLVGTVVIGGWHGGIIGLVAGLANVGFSLLALGVGVSSGLHRYRLASLAQGANGLGFAAFTLLAVLVEKSDVSAIAGLGFSAACFSLPLWLWLARQFPRRGEEENYLHLIRRSKAFIGIGLSNSGFFRIDSLLVLLVASASTAGLYASAYRVLGPFALIGSGFGVVLFARLASLPIGPEWHRLRRLALRGYRMVVLPLAAATFLVLPWALPTVFGPAFVPAVTPARILVLSLVPKAFYWPGAYALTASGREGVVFRVFFIGMVVDAVLVAGFTPLWGASGTASAWLVTECLVLVGISRATRAGDRCQGGRKAAEA